MALAAVLGYIVAVGAFILGHGTVELRALRVQPWLAEHMLITGSMTVVTDAGAGSIGPPDIMAGIAHGLVILEFIVAWPPVGPTRTRRRLAPVRTEMTFEATRNIFPSLTIKVMTCHACQGSIRHYLGTVKG